MDQIVSHILFLKEQQAISRTTETIHGIFVFMLMHFYILFQISVQEFLIMRLKVPGPNF